MAAKKSILTLQSKDRHSEVPTSRPGLVFLLFEYKAYIGTALVIIIAASVGWPLEAGLLSGAIAALYN